MRPSRLLSIACALTTLAAIGAPAGAQSPPSVVCAPLSIRVMRPAADNSYLFSVSSGGQYSLNFHLEVSTLAATYGVDVPNITFEEPLPEGMTGFRTRAMLVKNPAAEPLVLATFKATNARGIPCPVSTKVLRLWDDRGRPHEPEVTTYAPDKVLYDQLKSEAANAQPLVPALLHQDEPLTCKQPFAEAHIRERADVHYPTGALVYSQTGFTALLVAVDETGKILELELRESSGSNFLDNATAKAARASLYQPEIFRCKPLPSKIWFSVNFVGR